MDKEGTWTNRPKDKNFVTMHNALRLRYSIDCMCQEKKKKMTR